MKYNRLLKRKKLFDELAIALNYPLSLIVAPMGYGKTTVVEEYFTSQAIEALWLYFEVAESSPSYIWDTLSRQLKGSNLELGQLFATMGFPYTSPQRNQIIQLIESIAKTKELYIVIDDYQFNHSSEVDTFLISLIRANIKGLRLVLLSRTTPELNITELELKNKCYRITEKYFTLSLNEVGKLYRLEKVPASNAIIEKTYNLSEGWISAALLLVRRYKEIASIDSVEDIEALITSTIMTDYEFQKESIAVLGILDSFSVEQLSAILGESVAKNLIQKLVNKSAFIRYNKKSKRYAIHNIFTKYLFEHEYKTLDKEIQKTYYKNAGIWFSNNDYIMEGIRFYLEAEEYELILKEFQKESIAKIFDYYPEYVTAVMNQIPMALIYQYPLAYISYLHFLITAHDMSYGIKLLMEMDAYIKEESHNQLFEDLNIHGEVEFLKGLLAYNNVEKMFEHQKKAYDIIGGPSLTTRPDKMPCAGSYSVLHMYHKKPKQLKNVTDIIRDNIFYYDKLSNRIGTGIEHLVMAEYYLEIGRLKEAETYAKKGLFKSEGLPQVDVIICCKHVLARCKIASGNIKEALNIMNTIVEGRSYEDSALFQSIRSPYFFAMDSIYLKTKQLERVSDALKDVSFDDKVLFFQSRGLGSLLYGQYLMHQKKYLELEVYCEALPLQFKLFNNIFGFINSYVLESIALYRLYGIEKGKDPLEKALDLGLSDGIITSFAEYGDNLLPVLEDYRSHKSTELKAEETQYLNKLIEQTLLYAQLYDEKREGDEKARLTDRENDIMLLLCTGKKNSEIAKTLYISESAVKKMLSSIYRKYNVKNRISAIEKYRN